MADDQAPSTGKWTGGVAGWHRRVLSTGTVLALGLSLVALGTAAGPAAAEPAKYRFSPVNQYGINRTAAYWNPVIAWVSQRSGVALELKVGRTSADTTAYVLGQEVEFVFSNHLFSPEREKLGWKVFGRRQTPPVYSQIVVPANSPITDLASLQGREVGFAGPEALLIYKIPMAMLMGRGLGVTPVFGGNMDATLVQLFNGKVAAAGSNSQLIDAYAQREGKAYRVIWRTGPFHDLALMAAAKVPERDLRAVSAAFLAMHTDPQGRRILAEASKSVGLPEDTAFVRSDGSEYAAYREFYQHAPASLQ